MGNLIRTVGNGNYLPVIKRAVGLLSDGSAVMMVAEHNQAGVTGDGGDNSGTVQLLIYHSTNRTSWTLKNTLTAGAGILNVVASMVVDSGDNIHIAYRASGTTIWYTKGTFSAGPTWAFAAGVQVASALTGYNSMSLLDIDTMGNSTSAVVIGAYWYQTTAGSKKTAFMSYARATTGGAWVPHAPVVCISGDSHLGYADDMTIVGDNVGGLSGTTGYFAWYVTRKGSNGTDHGDVLYVTEVNTSSGAWMSRKLVQSGIYKGAGGGFRKFWLFNSGANRYDLVGVVDANDFKISVYRFDYNRSTGVITSRTPVATSAGRSRSLWRRTNNHNWAAVAHNGEGRYFFFGIADGMSVVATAVITAINAIVFGSGWSRWDNGYGGTAGFWASDGKFTPNGVGWLEQVWSGATRNWGRPRIDLGMFHHSPTGTLPQSFRVESKSILLPNAPDGITPAASSTVSTDRPTIGGNHRLQMYYAQLPVKMHFQVASDAGFSTNLRDILEDEADFLLADGTSTPYNKSVKSTEVLDAIEELSQGTWYIRAQSQDYSYNYGPWSSGQSFVITHPPVGVDLYPTAGAVFLYAGVGNVTFTWKFTDPSPYDNQSAYQITVENANDGSVILDSGKVLSTVQSATLAIPVGGKDIDLRWKLTLWDSDDVAGPASPYQIFYVTDPPAPVINTPAESAVLSTGIPTITWTPGIGGTKTQARYRVLVTQGSTIFYNSNWIDSEDTSFTLPVGYLSNDQQYTFRVEVQDNLGLQGFDTVAISTDWIEPAGPANDWEVYLHEYAKRGFVYITWTDANMDPDFSSWNVYRRRRGDSSWTHIATVTSGAGRYAYRDYFVGSGRTYEYTITQMVDRFGDLIESSPTKIVRVVPDADNYWLVDPVVPSNSIPLYQVTNDPFTEEYEQETTHIIGAGRHVEYGDRLGYTGSISSQLRDKFTVGMARENYALNPAMSYQSVNSGLPDSWLLALASETTAFSDTFTRTESNGLGAGWATSGGVASNYAVNGTKAVITTAVKGTEYIVIPTVSSLADFDITLLVNSSDLTADAGSNNPTFSAWARYVDGNNNVRIRAWFTSGNITLNVTERIAGVDTSSAGFPSVTGTTINSLVWLRFRGVGSTLQVKGWLDGQSQPTAWHVEYTTALLTAGGFRFSASVPAAYSGTVPKNFTMDDLTILSVPVVGEVSTGYYETRNPSPSGKTPYRVYSDGLGVANSDNVRLENTISGYDLPDKMKVPGTTVVLTAWVAVSSLNASKRYRLSVAWLDGAGAQTSQVDSALLDPVIDGVESYIPATSLDAAAGNATEVWRRLRFTTTVPGTVPAGVILKVRLLGNGGSVSPGELIVSGVQFETGQMTEYFDGDQFGGSWSGEPYLSYSYGTGYYTARQQRDAMERIKAQKTWVFLRNPFGDLWKVAPGDISVQRIAGVGKSELADVEMPYQEVDS